MPFVVSAAEATLEPAAQQVSQSLTNALARKWKENRGKVRSWIHTRLAFCMIIRGSSNQQLSPQPKVLLEPGGAFHLRLGSH